MVVIIDYGMGNLNSILYKLIINGVEAKISNLKEDILSASHLILPGVGRFDAGIRNLRNSNFIDAFEEKVMIHKVPILGICLGMQLLGKRSEEGKEAGLGWINAETVKFVVRKEEFKVPHMGWNTVVKIANSILWDLDTKNPFFEAYFAHSYHLAPVEKDLIIGECDYQSIFPAVIQKDNIYGVQFHPEKSRHSGINLLLRFCNAYYPNSC